MIRASLASIPERAESLRSTVASLLPQVDRLGAYLNGYDDVPSCLDDPRIDVARSQEHGDRGDAGKMFWTDAGDFDYHLACDDDLLYPPDFAERMVAAVEGYGRRALVGLHGALLHQNPKDYYRSRAKVYHGLSAVEGAHSVHVVATSSLCWHRSIPITPEIFEHPNMADMWVSAWANERDIPRIVIPHEKGWLRSMKAKGDTIWDASRRRDGGAMDTSEIQGRIARETTWRASPLPETPPAAPRLRAVVSLITYAREDALRILLDDVERERRRFDGEVEVRVYDDASPDYEGVRQLCRERGYVYVCAPHHYGKAEHYRLVSQELSDLRDIPADWYVFLPDDVRLCGDFFARAAAVWETLEDPVALNLAHHLSRPGGCWTHVNPREIGEGVETGWVDGLYICRRDLLERIGYRVPIRSQRWVTSWVAKNGSSGVGKAVSQALVDSGARLYRVTRSLTQHQGVPSIMHTARREAEPHTHMDPVEPFVPAKPTIYTRPPRPEPRLSIAMMAHPQRAASVERILSALDRNCTVVWDEKQDRWDTGRRAWLAFDPEATHHAVIQDDVLLCRDLCAGVERALAYVPPDAPLCGYVGRARPYHRLVDRGVSQTTGRAVSFLTMHTLNWGLLVVVPKADIAAMLSHCDTLTHVENYDKRLSRYWSLVRHSRIWYTWPSLVDHADGPSMIPGRDSTDRTNGRRPRIAHSFIGENASALDLAWAGDVINVSKPSVSKPRQPRPPIRPPRRYRTPQEHPPIVVRTAPSRLQEATDGRA